MSLYYVGNLVVVGATFYSSTGVATDPTDTGIVYFYMQDPQGVITTYNTDDDAELVIDGAGVFHVNVTLDSPGIWKYAWRSTGATLQTAVESSLRVEDTAFPS